MPNDGQPIKYGHEVSHLYRINDKRYSVTIDAELELYGSKTEIEVWRWKVAKTTPMGWWIHQGFNSTRFVRKDAYKVYAAPSYELALESYLKRKERQAAIYYSRAEEAERCAYRAKESPPPKIDSDDFVSMTQLRSYAFGFVPSRILATPVPDFKSSKKD